VLNELRENHLDEEGVADATYQILSSAGLLKAPDVAAREDASDAPGESLWTPEGSRPAENEAKSAIWTP